MRGPENGYVDAHVHRQANGFWRVCIGREAACFAAALWQSWYRERSTVGMPKLRELLRMSPRIDWLFAQLDARQRREGPLVKAKPGRAGGLLDALRSAQAAGEVA